MVDEQEVSAARETVVDESTKSVQVAKPDFWMRSVLSVRGASDRRRPLRRARLFARVVGRDQDLTIANVRRLGANGFGRASLASRGAQIPAVLASNCTRL